MLHVYNPSLTDEHITTMRSSCSCNTSPIHCKVLQIICESLCYKGLTKLVPAASRLFNSLLAVFFFQGSFRLVFRQRVVWQFRLKHLALQYLLLAI